MEHVFLFIQTAFSVVGIASFFAAMTKTKADDRIVDKARKLLNLIALNVRHAENVMPVKAEPRRKYFFSGF